MFVILLSYTYGIEPILQYLGAHRAFLDRYYQAGNFVCSGAQKPRVGGVIICHASSREEVENIIKEDPFNINGAASYQIIEFEASKCVPELKKYE